MLLRLCHLLGASLLVAVTLISSTHASVAFAVTPSGQVASDHDRLQEALSRLAASKARVRRIQVRLAATSRRLDTIVARHERLQEQLTGRVGAMYRTGETPFIAVLMNARTYEDFVSSWALLGRMNRQDANLLRKLAESKRSVAKAADDLMRLQVQAAKDADAQRSEVARARTDLASSRAALVLYQQRVRSSATPTVKRASNSKPSEEPRKEDSPQGRRGSGEWGRAVASHYGRNFTGRGASGARIGPYSMMVAHKTLPFGTLVEFRYNGKRAVARVADRGPHVAGRTFDLGPGVVRVLGFSGVHSVQYRVIGR